MKIRILHVTPTFAPAWHAGGIVRSLANLCRALSSLDCEVHVYTTDSDGHKRMAVRTESPTDYYGVRVRYFPVFCSHRYRYSPGLVAACKFRRREFDLVHITSFWCHPGVAAAAGAKRAGIPYVVSPRGTLIRGCLTAGALWKLPYYYAREWPVLRDAAAIHYTTESERRATAYLRIDRPSFTVPNPIDVDAFIHLPARAQARRGLDIPPDTFVIGSAGRLHRRKALDVLIDGIARAREVSPRVTVLLAGPDDGAEEGLRQAVGERGMCQCVRFLGHLTGTEYHRYLACLDAACLVSRPGDNFGNAVAEAMAASVPVIVSDSVGIADDVRNWGAGIVVRLTPDEIARAISTLAANEQGRSSMADAAGRCARALYADRAAAGAMLECYRQIVASSGS